MMRKLLYIYLVILFYGLAYSAQFKVISTINEGQDGGYGFIRAFDTNHNGSSELVFNSYRGLGNWYVIDYEYNINASYPKSVGKSMGNFVQARCLC